MCCGKLEITETLSAFLFNSSLCPGKSEYIAFLAVSQDTVS